MPKSKKTDERENWSWNGFSIGVLVGAFVYYLALSYGTNPLIAIARIVTLVFYIFGLFFTLYNVYRRKAYISPYADGIISGFGFSITMIDMFVHGLRLF